ncbi:MAG: hypothetical protein OXC65_00430 [Thiotrichales bacterium]|nr:hypothetical protein [Thiotrichales bacterium]
MRKTANAASMQVADAILMRLTLTAPPEFTVDLGDADSGLRITRSSGDAMIKLNQTEMQAKDKKFEPEGGADAPTRTKWDDDWMGKMFTYTDSDGKEPMESATVYTNIEAAKDADWTSNGIDSTSNGVTIAETGIVTIAASDSTSVDVMRFTGNILPSAPTSGESTTKRHAASTPQAGTFYGVSGTFSCDAACVVTRTSEGNITVSTALTFTPTIPSGKTAADLKAKNAMADSDYLHFGYWMESTKQKDDTYKHAIRTFAGEVTSGTANAASTAGFAASDGIEGSATYSGAAAGRYVRKSDFDAGGDAGVVEDGTFVADVDLTAQFDEEEAGTVAAADQWSIKGEVSNFMDGNEDLGWTLMLNKANMGTRNAENVVAGPNATLSGGTTTGSAGARPGTWSGTMYGNANPGDDNDAQDAADPSNDYPTGVAGVFNGHFTNGHVAGAFGAEYDD